MNNITSAPNIINCGNPSSTNLKVRNRMKDNKETTSEIFAKLNKRGKLDPRQNAMNYQLTNDHQLFRFYVQDVEPKLEKSNETNGENPNDLLKKEIQRLINVGDTKNDVMTKLLQGKLSDLTQSDNTAGTTPPSAAAIAAAIAGVLPAPVAGPSASDIASAIAGALAAAGIGIAPPSGGGAGGGPATSGVAGTAPPASTVTSTTTPPTLTGSPTVAFAPAVTVAPTITSTPALAAAAGAASTAGSSLLVMTPGTTAAVSSLVSMSTSTNTNIFLPTKDGTGQDYSLPVTTYLKLNAAGNWSMKKNMWPSLDDHVGSKLAWDRIIPNLDNSDFQLRLDKMNEFVLLYPKPKDFFDTYKTANPAFGTGFVASPSASPAPSGGAAGGAAGGGISGISGIPLSPITAPTSPSAAAGGVALFPPIMTKAQRWASKARAAGTGADAAAYTSGTGVNTVLFSGGGFGV